MLTVCVYVTVSLYKSKSGILYLHDFATNEHINCFEVVMRLFNCNYYKALEIIAKDFGLIEGTQSVVVKPTIVDTIKKSETCKIECQIKDFTNDELNRAATQYLIQVSKNDDRKSTNSKKYVDERLKMTP